MKGFRNILLILWGFSLGVGQSGYAEGLLVEGIDAVSFSVGQSRVALVRDSASVFINPSGLGQVKKRGGQMTAFNYLESSRLSGTYAMPFYLGSLGVGYSQIRVPDIVETTYNDSTGLGEETGRELSAMATMAMLSYGLRVKRNAYVGLSVGQVTERYFDMSGQGLLCNIGATWRLTEDLQLGGVINHVLGLPFQYSDGEPVTRSKQLRLGLAWRLWTKKSVLLISGSHRSERTTVQIGAISQLSPEIRICSGVNSRGKTIGLGLLLNGIRIDVAWQQPDSSLVAPHLRVSIGVE